MNPADSAYKALRASWDPKAVLRYRSTAESRSAAFYAVYVETGDEGMLKRAKEERWRA